MLNCCLSFFHLLIASTLCVELFCILCCVQSGRLEPEVRSNEIRFNVTETEFVVVQDSSRSDTDAVILRCTAALQLCPDLHLFGPQQRRLGILPLRCGLERLEVRSFLLME